jgi:tRNA pseudouridine55 synthase
MARKKSLIHGVVVIDKPKGMTSHDVVQRVRRKLRERRVGHAGTLDPMATGVLVVMVGEATKLGPFLTAEDKSYAATVTLGRSTDTLDTEGETIDEAPIPSWWPAQAASKIDAALVAERARTEQRPPVYSAIKVEGKTAHSRVRAGEEVELAPRAVSVRGIERGPISDDGFSLTVNVAKGYYVRSLARDLGERLGVPAHVSALRRLQSGAFTNDGAVGLHSELSLLSLVAAASSAMPTVSLNEEGVERASHGGPMEIEHFVTAPPREGHSAWLDPDGRLVAVGRFDAQHPAVVRGFITR